jgi:hypothetical protein
MAMPKSKPHAQPQTKQDRDLAMLREKVARPSQQ